MQRAAEWKATLREEPKVARLLLRRLIGPLVLTDDSQRPDWIDAEAEVKTGLLDGIHDVASLTFASWNQIGGWLRQLNGLRQAA